MNYSLHEEISDPIARRRALAAELGPFYDQAMRNQNMQAQEYLEVWHAIRAISNAIVESLKTEAKT